MSAALVTRLKEAAAAYYNGGPLTMDDDTYDALVEQLRAQDPKHPFLTTIGAPPSGTTVPLPFPMPSLDKIKPGQDALTKFLSQRAGFILTEKLDGLSALWISDKRALYLRGDGLIGQDISHLVPLGIKGLVTTTGAAIRGELVVRRADVSTLARSWVNGVIHRKSPDPADVTKIRFVAYDVMAPAQPTRTTAFTWLQGRGFELPWLQAQKPTEESLIQALKDRRVNSPYDTDGIVVAIDAAPVRATTAVNPKDMVAFKMPLSEQTATTTVVAVHWGTSSQGYLIPRLEIEPVVINGATIQFCTAHNAKTVETARLGPGARVAIRRSGDVIPTIDSVVAGASGGPSFPPTETWEWAGEVHIRAKGGSKELTMAKLHHFLKTLEIPGSGPATAAALVEGGVTGPKALLAAPEARLKELLGPKTGASLYANVRTALATSTEQRLMIASSLLPRGVGETKLAALFAKSSNPRAWRTAFGCEAPSGWTAGTFQAFLEELPKVLEWREKELGAISVAAVSTAAPAAPATRSGPSEVICMTGFRDKALEAAATAAGHTIAAAFTSKVTLLLVPDGELKESEKVKAARAKGIRIVSRSQFKV